MNHPNTSPVRRTRHSLTSLVFLTALIALVVSPLAALAQAEPEPIQVAGTPIMLRGGAGNQTDPHISGTLVAYTVVEDTSSEIRHHNLVSGSDTAIPNNGQRDSLPDASGTTIVFRRVHTDGSTITRPIMAFDTANPAAGSVELDPVEGARRALPAIGGRTVAWMELVETSSNRSDIVAYDLDSGQATPVTTDGADVNNREPAVSPDGSVLTWVKCLPTSQSCDIYAVRKNADGTWGAATQISDDPNEEILPDTNGQIVAYASNPGGSYLDFDIWWVNVDGTDASHLVMPGVQYNTNMSGNLIAFESESVGSANSDLFVYDLTTGLLYQVTNTPDVDETLNDISVAPDGSVQLVWAQADGISIGNNDVYAMSFELTNTGTPSYEICPLFDQSKSHRVNSTVQIRLQLCDAQGQNHSSSSLVLTAVDLVKIDSISSPSVVDTPGNSNPDNSFRYDDDIEGYAFNLKTRNLSAGTWELRFTITGDPKIYSITFDLR